AGGGLLLLVGVCVVGAAIFYFAVYKNSAKTETSVSVSNSYSKPPSDKTSTVTPNSTTRTIDDFVRSQVGDYKVTNTIPGTPSTDGFPGAIEEKQYKYANSRGTFSIHYTIARYPTTAQAQQALRDSIGKY